VLGTYEHGKIQPWASKPCFLWGRRVGKRPYFVIGVWHKLHKETSKNGD
jgi:hypothetical protein